MTKRNLEVIIKFYTDQRGDFQLNHDLYSGGVIGLQAAQEVFQASDLGGTRQVAG